MAIAACTMTVAQFRQLRRIIHDCCGIWFPDAKKHTLETRLADRLRALGVDDFGRYMTHLTDGPRRLSEMREMLNHVTIHETSFFRNEPQLNAFERHVLPRLLQARRSSKRLRIWSAACSSGEEPYTLAIQLHRTLGVRLADWHVEILGTDISGKVLMTARQASYAAKAVRHVRPDVLHRYFTQRDGRYVLDPTIRGMAHFRRLNLKEAAGALGVFDAIFCRNVLIYFAEDMKRRCARLFHDRLASDGVLFIGHSESLRDAGVPLEPLPVPHAFAYVKRHSDDDANGD